MLNESMNKYFYNIIFFLFVSFFSVLSSSTLFLSLFSRNFLSMLFSVFYSELYCLITYDVIYFYFISLSFFNCRFLVSFYFLFNCILLDDWQVAKQFLLELHGINTDLEISKITEISDFSCVIKPCRGSASFGVSKASSLLEAEGMFRDLLGVLK